MPKYTRPGLLTITSVVRSAAYACSKARVTIEASLIQPSVQAFIQAVLDYRAPASSSAFIRS